MRAKRLRPQKPKKNLLKNHSFFEGGWITVFYLIAGLGNPGPKYRNTRHNIGFQIINRFCDSFRVSLRGRRFDSKYVEIPIDEHRVIIVRPLMYMNRSGMPVKAFADQYAVKVENILIIHDDIDLPLGRVKAVRSGGPGGHRGVSSIINHLSSDQFPRIKVGIGRPLFGETIEDYVLGSFYQQEREKIGLIREKVAQTFEMFIKDGIDHVMGRINSTNLS